MSNFRNVSYSEPCPICGKPDWCSIQYVEGGEKLHYCRRVLSGDNIISRVTGETFVFIKQTKDGSCMYKEEQAYLASREEWMKNNKGQGGQGSRPAERKTVASPEPQPVRSNEIIEPLENRQLDKIYRKFLSKLQLQKNHVQYFRKEKWPNELILKSRVKSMPPTSKEERNGITRTRIAAELIKEFGSLEGVPGFYEGPDGKWTFTGANGILIPLYDHEGNMYRLRLRLDHPEVDENGKEKNKYKNFSSYFEVEGAKGQMMNSFRKGCRAGSHIGLYETPDRDDYTICYITEGEKKSLFANYVLHNPIISLPGVNSFNKVLETLVDDFTVLDYLSGKGCRMIIIAYDADKYVNEAVLMYEKKLVELLTSKNFQIALAFWNPGFGKGLDDILSIDVRPNYELVKA